MIEKKKDSYLVLVSILHFFFSFLLLLMMKENDVTVIKVQDKTRLETRRGGEVGREKPNE